MHSPFPIIFPSLKTVMNRQGKIFREREISFSVSQSERRRRKKKRIFLFPFTFSAPYLALKATSWGYIRTHARTAGRTVELSKWI